MANALLQAPARQVSYVVSQPADLRGGSLGKLFTAQLSDGTERFAAGMGMGRSKLFVAMTRLLETEFLNMPSGIQDDHGQDEHFINANQFITFFDEFWAQGWIGERQSGFFHNWARHAAGMIENITLQPRDWVDRNGEKLEVCRYLRPEEFDKGMLKG